MVLKLLGVMSTFSCFALTVAHLTIASYNSYSSIFKPFRETSFKMSPVGSPLNALSLMILSVCRSITWKTLWKHSVVIIITYKVSIWNVRCKCLRKLVHFIVCWKMRYRRYFKHLFLCEYIFLNLQVTNFHQSLNFNNLCKNDQSYMKYI